MAKVAFIFPGQGSQFVGMGKDLFENFQAAREVFKEADEALGFKLSEMCFSGREEDLQLTANTQPAILTVSVAAFRTMESEGAKMPDFAAGHSLGEYSALVAAGVLNFTDAVRTVRKRGSYMQEAVPIGVGAMAAIVGLDADSVAQGCEEALDGQVCSPANINSPSQVVIAGDAGAIDRAVVLLKERGAKRAVKLNVSAPFHCALMKPAQDHLAADLQDIVFSHLSVPLITNADARPIEDGEEARQSLIRQVAQPVRWLESVEFLINQGVQTFIEVGPGKVLSGLMRQIDRSVRCVNVEDEASLRFAREALAN